MANRHLQRSVGMQSLFEWGFFAMAKKKKVEEVIKRNIKEFAPGIEDGNFVEKLVAGTLKYRKNIDEMIEKCAPE